MVYWTTNRGLHKLTSLFGKPEDFDLSQGRLVEVSINASYRTQVGLDYKRMCRLNNSGVGLRHM